MAAPLRVLHYLNQFFGGIGGEEKANEPPQVREGPVGPGRALQQALGANGAVIATIIGGDNYVVEEKAKALSAVKDALARYTPDVLVAGPAFEAGRYGLACAEVCVFAQAQGIPTVTGMYPDNPGVLTHRRELYCIPTGASTSDMPAVIREMAALALKLGRGQAPGPAAEDGYLPRGIRKPVMRERTGAERAGDMLKARLDGKPFATEVWVREFDVVSPPPPLKGTKDVTIALVTTGALVPKGNPDKMPPLFSTRYYRYSMQGLNDLTPDAWESVHAGFNAFILNARDPDYALPLAAARELEAKGAIKAVYPWMLTTAGVATAVKDSQNIGREMAKELKEASVGAALLVAT